MIPVLDSRIPAGGGYDLGDPGNPVPTNAMVVWYDFSAVHVWDGPDGTGNHGTQNMLVQSVTDLSGNARFLNQATSGDRPKWVGGVLGLTSQAIQQVSSDLIKTANITLANATSLTFVAVLKPADYGSGTETAVGFRSNATPTLTVGGLQRTAAKTWQVFGRNGSANIVANVALGIANDSDPLILVGVIEVGVGLRLYAAYGETFGLVATTADAGTTTGMTTNPEPICVFSRSSTFVDGFPSGSTAHELIVYKFALSSEQAYALMSQLVAKHFVGAGGGASPSSLRDGLDYRYLMNEASGTRYNSGGLGSAIAPLVESSPGTVAAVTIDGQLAAQMTENVGDLRITSSRFNMANSFTVTGWWTMNAVENFTFCQYTDGSTRQWEMVYDSGDDHLIFTVKDGSGTDQAASSFNAPQPDVEFFSCVRFDIVKGEIQCRFDSATFGDVVACTGITSVPDGVLYVNKAASIGGIATVRDFRVYNRALTDDEVDLLYSGG